MKKCEYCGRENADEVAACSGCGQAWFTAITPGGEQQAEIRKGHFLFRFLVALLVGFAVAGISLYVAWQNGRAANGLRVEQWITQMRLSELDEALRNYRKEFNAFPTSLNQLQAATNYANLQRFNKDKGLVDGWDREFLYSFDVTNGLVTSLGRDGKPGGVGLDHDLTNLNPEPRDSLMTFYQFLFLKPATGMIASCFVTGGLALLLCFFTVRQPQPTNSGVITLLIHLGVILIATCFVAAIISMLHIPTGH